MCSFETIRNSVGSSSARVAACPNLGCDDPNMGCLSVAGPKDAGPSSREGHVNLLEQRGFLAPTYEMIGSYEFRKGCGGAAIAKAEGARSGHSPVGSETARAANAWVVIGVIGRDRGTLYCTLLILAPNGSSGRQTPQVEPTAMERLTWGFGDGSALPVIDAGFGRIGTKASTSDTRRPWATMKLGGRAAGTRVVKWLSTRGYGGLKMSAHP